MAGDLWEVVIGAGLAMGSGWFLDGGIRRRNRRTIREEIELAALLGDRPEAAALRERADRRLIRYVTPWSVRVRQLSIPERFVSVAVMLLSTSAGAASLWMATKQPPGEPVPDWLETGIFAGIGVGTVAVLTFAFLEYGLIPVTQRLMQVLLGVFNPLQRVLIGVMKRSAVSTSAGMEKVMYGRRGRPDRHSPRDEESEASG